MLNRRWRFSYLILLLALLAFGVSTGVAIQRLNEAQEALSLQAEENLGWTVFQAERELLRLHAAIEHIHDDAQYNRQPAAEDLEALRLRYEIFWSRITILKAGRVGARVEAASGAAATLTQIEETLALYEPQILDSWNRGALLRLENWTDAWIEPLYRISLAVFRDEEERAEALRDQVDGAYTQMGISGGLTAFGFVALIFAMGRALRQSDRDAKRAAEARGQLRQAIEAINEGFALYDPEDRLVLYNREYARIYAKSAGILREGLTFEELLRHGLAQGQYPEAVGREEAWLAERLERHRNPGQPLEQALPNGHWVYIQEKKTDDGYTVGIRVDITDLKEARETAEKAVEAKSQFLAVMSHEIRTPLGGLLGMLDLMRDESLSEGAREKLATAIESAQILRTIVNDILDLSKLEAGKLSMECINFAPAQLADAAASTMGAKAAQKGLTLETEVDPDLPAVICADPARMQQIVVNFIDNAIKFTDAGKVRLKLSRVPAGDCDSAMKVAVIDQGIGIPEEAQARLFKDFSQVDPSYARRYGGTGLGLAICARLVEAMGGQIGVESEQGLGSCFWFSLPLSSCAASSDLPPVSLAAPSQPPAEMTVAADSRLLVAEDNPVNQRLIAGYLKKLSLTADFANNGLEAVARASARTYDLVLMDIAMPELDGLGATQRIRALDAPNGAVPIVALTANAMAEDKERSRAAGMNDHLAKPIDRDALYAVLQRWLPGAPAAEAAEAAPAERQAEEPAFDPAPLDQLVEAAGFTDADEVIREFEQDVAERIEALAASDLSDRAALAMQAHTLRGTGASFGALSIARLAAALEEGAEEMDRETASELIAAMQAAWPGLQEAYAAWRKAAAAEEGAKV